MEPTTRSRGLLWLNGINLTVLLGFMFFGTHDSKSWAAFVERNKSDGFMRYLQPRRIFPYVKTLDLARTVFDVFMTKNCLVYTNLSKSLLKYYYFYYI